MELSGLADEFAGLGGKRAFGVPGGGSSLELIDALAKRGVEFTTTGHETTAALMAGAVARQTGKPALAVTIKGPGFANLAPGLLCNAYEGFPMLSASEAYAPGENARRHKWLDHSRLAGEYLKAHRFLGGCGTSVGDCWARATAEFPGPAHLDLASGPAEKDEAAEISAPDDPGPLLDLARRAKRPAVIVGSIALRSPWRGLLASLRAPVFTTPAAKGAIDETLPHAAGVYTGDGKSLTPEKRLLPEADFVLGIGLRAGEVLDPAPPHAAFFGVDTMALRRGRLFPPSVPPRAFLADEDIAQALRALTLSGWAGDRLSESFAHMSRQALAAGWSPAEAFEAAQLILPDAVHVLDTGNFTVLGEHLLRARDPSRVLGTPNGRFMGAGIGYALGASIAAADKPVVLWIGDGGSRAFFGELALAAERRLRLLVLVMKDGRFGSISGRALAQGLTQAPLILRDRGCHRLAERMGFAADEARSRPRFEDFVKDWAAGVGPGLLSCEFDPETYRRAAKLLR